MVAAFKQWRVYLEGVAHPIQVFSDHKNLEYFSQARTTSRRHAKWTATLAAYDYAKVYRKFINNYSSLASPLTSLTRKTAKFRWSLEAEAAFRSL